MLAFAGTAVAHATTTASPTVSPNTTNPQNQSYSDKSNTSPGTNAVMDDKMKPMSTTDEDKALQKRKAKKKLASNSDPSVKQSPTIDGSMTATNPPTKTTDGAAANSTTVRRASKA